MASSHKGLFVSFEGIDGCGKSTQMSLLRRALQKQGYPVAVTREPGGTPLSEAVRAVILKGKSIINPRSELLLYLAARAQNVSEVILPALQKGRIVLCDRFSDSTLAYQGAGRGLSPSEIRRLDAFACAGLKPDITFLFDLPAGAAMARITKTGREKDRMEKEGLRFMTKVRKAYLELAKSETRRFVIIHSGKAIEAVHAGVLKAWNSKTHNLYLLNK